MLDKPEKRSLHTPNPITKQRRFGRSPFTIGQLSHKKMRTVLTVAAKMATNKQFEMLLQSISRDALCTLFEEDTISRFRDEHRELSLRRNREEFQNNLDLIAVRAKIYELEQVRRVSSLGSMRKIISDLERRGRSPSREMTEQLPIMLANARQVIERLTSALDLPECVSIDAASA